MEKKKQSTAKPPKVSSGNSKLDLGMKIALANKKPPTLKK
jgi:hypothetical protein